MISCVIRTIRPPLSPSFISWISRQEDDEIDYKTNSLSLFAFQFVIFVAGLAGPYLDDSPYIYRPDRRSEIWRYVTYMLLHEGWKHLLTNLCVQMFVGLPLEMVHGSWRVGCIYMSGVLAGSLSTSVFAPEVSLIGASGGAYALLTAHLANVMLNYRSMRCGWVKILGVIVIASSDVGRAIFNRYIEPDGLPVSYLSHIAGALAGVTAGLLLLRNFEKKFHEHFLWWAALLVYSSCMLFAILYNVFNIDGIASPEEIY